MMRYIRSLERKDVGLDTSMIPLGSCTMKLNAASEMYPVTWPEFSRMHPFAPADQTEGYRQICAELEKALCEITGFAGVSLQPNSGAQGEFAGLLVIRAYHQSRGEGARDVVLIPASAHGTNPGERRHGRLQGRRRRLPTPNGNVDVADLKKKAEEHAKDLAGLMITYPSTHGVFEEVDQRHLRHRPPARRAGLHGRREHERAGRPDQSGATSAPTCATSTCTRRSPSRTAAAVPAWARSASPKHLAPFLPGHPLVKVGGEKAIPPVSAAPWGSASILLISYAYIRMLGGEGVTDATRYAILNANYIKSRLEKHYDVLYTRDERPRRARDDLRPAGSSRRQGVEEGDVAKRLMDYGFHAPTVSFPVAGHADDRADGERAEGGARSVLRRDDRDPPGDRGRGRRQGGSEGQRAQERAAHGGAVHGRRVDASLFARAGGVSAAVGQGHKFWPSVGRIDNPYGDRNLICICPPMEAYASTVDE